ncbi:FAD:protein FMN transferase [Streptantibioticus rubrisoli]|uniref:FAD:protein FMN transferase n=1 Tax=Streptantibioticus rubrisoli TaxID=1387313 RepID=A0ABT1PDN6_9ACTN|nr:FAD:protein FMN transferase [Streptantibioticus rubrisoli]MCQ4043479.1 FAD:protein FMN transferase [Streptantibioticus rubrisoli]
MGTVFSFDVTYGGGLAVPRAVEAAVASLHTADAVFSKYRPDSQLSRLARGGLALAECDPVVAEVLRLCERARERTGGWFSAGYAGGLDPTGLVKGWAVERAARMIADAGAYGVCVNGGGDVQLLGEPEPGRRWRVGVTDPLRRDALATVVEGAGELAVATSGTAERGHHVLDPHTGRPPLGAAVSVTVVTRSLTDADAWATAAFAMGATARRWLEAVPDAEGFAVGGDGETWQTSGFARTSAARTALGIR